MSIKVFFHICAMTRAEEVVRNMIQSIHFSGLYDDAEAIYCYLSGQEQIIRDVTDLINISGHKFHIIKCVPEDTSYERLTLEDIHNHITADDKILYIHSKGVSIHHQCDPLCIKRIDDWTYIMMYYLVRHYKLCLEKLDIYDTVGINFSKEPSPHYSGNFWWVKGQYFLGLPIKIGPHYHDTELKFLFLNNPKYYETYKTTAIDHYQTRCEPFKYVDAKI